MFNILKFFKSKLGMQLLSILLGLGLASLFKMSCDSRDCLVYKAAELTDTKVIKYDNVCYETSEKIEKCDAKKESISI